MPKQLRAREIISVSATGRKSFVSKVENLVIKSDDHCSTSDNWKKMNSSLHLLYMNMNHHSFWAAKGLDCTLSVLLRKLVPCVTLGRGNQRAINLTSQHDSQTRSKRRKISLLF